MPDIKHSIVIESLPERVYPLVASGTGFSRWWAADVTEQESGSIAELGFFNRATIFRLKRTRAAASIETEWLCQTGGEWQNTKLMFRLQPSDRQTVLRFSHTDWQHETDYFVSCNTTWGELMYRLKAAAEGKSSRPLFSMTGLDD
jgi:uncharacterized protein YndB with AHSA1/START domain